MNAVKIIKFFVKNGVRTSFGVARTLAFLSTPAGAVLVVVAEFAIKKAAEAALKQIEKKSLEKLHK